MPNNTIQPTLWEKCIPWFLTIACTFTLISIALFLVLNIEWFKDNAFPDKRNIEYNIYAYQMYLAMIKGSIGLFSGFALMFLGTGVAFYSLKDLSKINLEGKSIKISLVSASPGIIAMALGAAMVMFTIGSKNEFPQFESKSHIEVPPIND